MRIEVATSSDFRKNIADWLDRVTNNAIELHVTRRGGKPVIVVDAREYSSLVRTLNTRASLYKNLDLNIIKEEIS
jgi:prevent-host-death family protein